MCFTSRKSKTGPSVRKKLAALSLMTGKMVQLLMVLSLMLGKVAVALLSNQRDDQSSDNYFID